MSKRDEERIMEDFRSGKISMDTAKREIQAIRVRETIEMQRAALASEPASPVEEISVIVDNQKALKKFNESTLDYIIKCYPGARISLKIKIKGGKKHGKGDSAAGCQSPGNIPE